MFKKFSLIAGIAMMSLSSAHAIVISDSNVTVAPTTAFGASYAITTTQSSTYYDITTMLFVKKDNFGKTILMPVAWNLDAGADYYLVKPGEIFTPNSISSRQFKPFFILDKAYVLEVPFPGEFYLGVATTGPGPIPGGEPTSEIGRNVWGWVHLVNDASGLSAVGSAMAYGEGGIVIGTTIAIPEPGTLLLSAIGMAGLALARRRSSNRSGLGRTPRPHLHSNA